MLMHGNETEEQTMQQEFDELQEFAGELLDTIECTISNVRDDVRDFRLHLVMLEGLRKNLTA